MTKNLSAGVLHTFCTTSGRTSHIICVYVGSLVSGFYSLIHFAMTVVESKFQLFLGHSSCWVNISCWTKRVCSVHQQETNSNFDDHLSILFSHNLQTSNNKTRNDNLKKCLCFLLGNPRFLWVHRYLKFQEKFETICTTFLIKERYEGKRGKSKLL